MATPGDKHSLAVNCRHDLSRVNVWRTGTDVVGRPPDRCIRQCLSQTRLRWMVGYGSSGWIRGAELKRFSYVSHPRQHCNLPPISTDRCRRCIVGVTLGVDNGEQYWRCACFQGTLPRW